jgi:hypothetical protein
MAPVARALDQDPMGLLSPLYNLDHARMIAAHTGFDTLEISREL